MLDVGLIVFLVGSAAGEGAVLLFAVALQIVIDEFGAVIRVQAQQCIGQAAAAHHKRGADGGLAAVEQAVQLYPTGFDVKHVQAVKVLTPCRFAAVRHQVDLHEARLGIRPTAQRSALESPV